MKKKKKLIKNKFAIKIIYYLNNKKFTINLILIWSETE